MPELPEVETVRRALLATVLGRRVESVEVLSKQSLAVPGPALDRQLVGRRLAAVAPRRVRVLNERLDDRGRHRGPCLLSGARAHWPS